MALTPTQRHNVLAQAAALELARERTAKQYGISQASMNTLSAFYAMQQAGGQPRSKALIRCGLATAQGAARHTGILREAGLVEYAPGTNRGVRVTTAGKLVCNAYSREIERVSNAITLV